MDFVENLEMTHVVGVLCLYPLCLNTFEKMEPENYD